MSWLLSSSTTFTILLFGEENVHDVCPREGSLSLVRWRQRIR